MKEGSTLKIILVLLFFMTISLSTVFLFSGANTMNVFNHQNDDNEIRIMAEMFDGQMMFSTDGGETWSEELRDRISAGNENGMKNFMNRGQGNGSGTLVKLVEGKRMYSTDGGKSWSETPPEELNN